ncbi:MAG: hypothetical protein EKK55_16420 [Rhodocyclaceae bacterium]|nr:MAG: hypothetical protein EKK55_16420 [Rhodocyclaceae bacterium]
MAVVDPFGPGAAAGGAAAVSYTEVTVTCTGDLDAGTGNEDFAITLPADGLIVHATLTRTAGDSTNLGALLYEGDPADGGTLIGAIFGVAFSAFGYDLSAGPKTGPLINAGGSDIPAALPYSLTDPYVRLTNRDFSNTGRSSLTLTVLDVA